MAFGCRLVLDGGQSAVHFLLGLSQGCSADGQAGTDEEGGYEEDREDSEELPAESPEKKEETEPLSDMMPEEDPDEVPEAEE